MCIFSFLIIPWYFFYLFKRSVIKFDINVISKIIRFSIPIIPSILLSNFTPIISRVFLRDFGSKNTIAAFAVISKLTSPLTAIQTALKVLYVPQIVEKDNLDKNPDHLLLIAFKYFSVLLLATLIIALFADDVVFLFFSNSIGSIKNLHLFFIATFLSNIYTYFSIGIFLANKNSYFWIPILCQIIIMIFPGVYLIENFELNGLLISELLKYFFYVFSGYILSLYFYRFPSKSFLFVVPLILVIFFLVLFDFLEGNINIVMLSFLKVTLIIFIIKNIPFLYSRVQNFLLSI
jgi:O-antigen/teichoic acid export membrane protein